MRSFESLSTAEKAGAAVIALALIAGGGYTVEKYFLPENAVQVNEDLPENTETSSNPEEAGSTTLKSGSFEGKTGHTVKGTVKLVEVDGEKYLRFENYTQTQGPDVFVYLTPSKTPDTSEEISEARKIRIEGGPDGGEITKEGNFNQKLPDDIEVSKYNGVAIWCDAFSVPFGYASIEK